MARCLNRHCNRPTHDGRPGYCSKTCRLLGMPAPSERREEVSSRQPMCLCCDRPAHQERSGEFSLFCTRKCRDAAPPEAKLAKGHRHVRPPPRGKPDRDTSDSEDDMADIAVGRRAGARQEVPQVPVTRAATLPRWSEVVDEVDHVRPWRREPCHTANNKVALWQGQITRIEIDAVVNAANEQLAAGGGVCGAIHDAAGSKLAAACRLYGPGCPEGQTVLTPGFDLPAQYVLHTVGPMNQDTSLLRSAYRTVLDLAVQNGIRSVAMCCVGTGIFGFPLEEATHVALSTVRDWLDERMDMMDLIVFVMFQGEELRVYKQLMPVYFPAPRAVARLRTPGGEQENLAEVTDIPCGKAQPSLCVKCGMSERTHVFLPCAHVALCDACAAVHKEEGPMTCPCCHVAASSAMKLRYGGC